MSTKKENKAARDAQRRCVIELAWSNAQTSVKQESDLDIIVTSRKLKDDTESPSDVLFRTHQYEFRISPSNAFWDWCGRKSGFIVELKLFKKMADTSNGKEQFQEYTSCGVPVITYTFVEEVFEGSWILNLIWPDEKNRISFRGEFCFRVQVYRKMDDDTFRRIIRKVSSAFKIVSKPEVFLRKKRKNEEPQIPSNKKSRHDMIMLLDPETVTLNANGSTSNSGSPSNSNSNSSTSTPGGTSTASVNQVTVKIEPTTQPTAITVAAPQTPQRKILPASGAAAASTSVGPPHNLAPAYIPLFGLNQPIPFPSGMVIANPQAPPTSSSPAPGSIPTTAPSRASPHAHVHGAAVHRAQQPALQTGATQPAASELQNNGRNSMATTTTTTTTAQRQVTAPVRPKPQRPSAAKGQLFEESSPRTSQQRQAVDPLIDNLVSATPLSLGSLDADSAFSSQPIADNERNSPRTGERLTSTSTRTTTRSRTAFKPRKQHTPTASKSTEKLSLVSASALAASALVSSSAESSPASGDVQQTTQPASQRNGAGGTNKTPTTSFLLADQFNPFSPNSTPSRLLSLNFAQNSQESATFDSIGLGLSLGLDTPTPLSRASRHYSPPRESNNTKESAAEASTSTAHDTREGEASVSATLMLQNSQDAFFSRLLEDTPTTASNVNTAGTSTELKFFASQ